MITQLSRDQLTVFLQFDYAETKDLCKHFLTLVAGVLVFSVTFSEKIVNFADASTKARTFLFSAWGLFMTAIVCCGVGLMLISIAAGVAQYGDIFGYTPSPYRVERWAVVAVLAAGMAFVAGMSCLLLSGAVTVFRRTETAREA